MTSTLTAPHAIEARGLVKVFGDTRAVDDLDLTIPTGGVYGVLGPNGAGKTTVIRMLATLLRPDGGGATVFGHDIVDDADTVRSMVSLTGQFASVDEDLTGMENLRLLAKLLGHRGAAATSRATELLTAFGLIEAADKQAKHYSWGMRRRLDIAASIVVTPDLLFLDETPPASTLGAGTRCGTSCGTRRGRHHRPPHDPVPRRGRPARRAHCGHRPREGHRRGHTRRTQGLGRRRRPPRPSPTPNAPPEAQSILQRHLDRPVALEPDPAALSARVDDAERVAAGLSALSQAAIDIATYAFGQPTLDEVFLALTGHTAESSPDPDHPTDSNNEEARS